MAGGAGRRSPRLWPESWPVGGAVPLLGVRTRRPGQASATPPGSSFRCTWRQQAPRPPPALFWWIGGGARGADHLHRARRASAGVPTSGALASRLPGGAPVLERMLESRVGTPAWGAEQVPGSGMNAAAASEHEYPANSAKASSPFDSDLRIHPCGYRSVFKIDFTRALVRVSATLHGVFGLSALIVHALS